MKHSLLTVGLLIGFFAALTSFGETNLIARLEADPVMVRRLGLGKLTTEEKNEWNQLLWNAFNVGQSAAGTSQKPAAVQTPNSKRNDASQIWFSKADLEGEETISLRNGAIFNVSSGSVGYGYGREVALIKDGSRWSLWVSGKRIYRGEVVRMPSVGKPLSYRKANVSKVSSSGAVVVMDDGSIFQIDELNRITTTLWLPVSEILILETGQLLNLSDSDGDIVNSTRLK